jgi:alpha-galactosidase
VKIINQGKAGIVLQKAASMNLDWMNGEYEWITFYGRHVIERNVQRSALDHGIHAIGRVRGTSSHHYNPFAIVCEKNADEEKGSCYGFSYLYSFVVSIQIILDGTCSKERSLIHQRL